MTTDPFPPDVIMSIKIPTKYGDVVILKSKDDPIATRISIGGEPNVGYYCNYRGDLNEVRRILEIILETLDDPQIPADFI